jgi:hypothetical protein
MRAATRVWARNPKRSGAGNKSIVFIDLNGNETGEGIARNSNATNNLCLESATDHRISPVELFWQVPDSRAQIRARYFRRFRI